MGAIHTQWASLAHNGYHSHITGITRTQRVSLARSGCDPSTHKGHHSLTIPINRAHGLQALVYDILPSTTAVFSYAIGPRKLSANEHFFFCCCCCWSSNSNTFVTNNSDYIRCLFYNWPCCLHQLKLNQSRLNRDGTLYPGWRHLLLTCVLGR